MLAVKRVFPSPTRILTATCYYQQLNFSKIIPNRLNLSIKKSTCFLQHNIPYTEYPLIFYTLSGTKSLISKDKSDIVTLLAHFLETRTASFNKNSSHITFTTPQAILQIRAAKYRLERSKIY